jgi:hypothetical protein
VIQNHQLSLQKPGGEIPANHSILKPIRKSVQELSPPLKGGVAGPLGYRRPGGGGQYSAQNKIFTKKFLDEAGVVKLPTFHQSSSPLPGIKI